MGYMLLLVEEGVTRSASGPDHDAWTSEGQSLSGMACKRGSFSDRGVLERRKVLYEGILDTRFGC